MQGIETAQRNQENSPPQIGVKPLQYEARTHMSWKQVIDAYHRDDYAVDQQQATNEKPNWYLFAFVHFSEETSEVGEWI
jgi:hypothetical protein